MVAVKQLDKLQFIFIYKDKKYTPSFSIPGPSCSKLTTSLVNVSLKFQPLISQICQYLFSPTAKGLKVTSLE